METHTKYSPGSKLKGDPHLVDVRNKQGKGGTLA